MQAQTSKMVAMRCAARVLLQVHAGHRLKPCIGVYGLHCDLRAMEQGSRQSLHGLSCRCKALTSGEAILILPSTTQSALLVG